MSSKSSPTEVQSGLGRLPWIWFKLKEADKHQEEQKKIPTALSEQNTETFSWTKYRYLCLNKVPTVLDEQNTDSFVWTKYWLFYMNKIPKLLPEQNPDSFTSTNYQQFRLNKIPTVLPEQNIDRFVWIKCLHLLIKNTFRSIKRKCLHVLIKFKQNGLCLCSCSKQIKSVV